MKLDNPFSLETKLLFIDHFWCAICNHSDQGLEGHHIVGRSSNSPFNFCPICTKCHSTIGHSVEEEQKLFAYTFKWLYNRGYKPVENDFIFFQENQNLFTDDLLLWLENSPSKNKNLQKDKLSKPSETISQ